MKSKISDVSSLNFLYSWEAQPCQETLRKYHMLPLGHLGWVLLMIEYCVNWGSQGCRIRSIIPPHPWIWNLIFALEKHPCKQSLSLQSKGSGQTSCISGLNIFCHFLSISSPLSTSRLSIFHFLSSTLIFTPQTVS